MSSNVTRSLVCESQLLVHIAKNGHSFEYVHIAVGAQIGSFELSLQWGQSKGSHQ